MTIHLDTLNYSQEILFAYQNDILFEIYGK